MNYSMTSMNSNLTISSYKDFSTVSKIKSEKNSSYLSANFLKISKLLKQLKRLH